MHTQLESLSDKQSESAHQEQERAQSPVHHVRYGGLRLDNSCLGYKQGRSGGRLVHVSFAHSVSGRQRSSLLLRRAQQAHTCSQR